MKQLVVHPKCMGDMAWSFRGSLCIAYIPFQNLGNTKETSRFHAIPPIQLVIINYIALMFIEEGLGIVVNTPALQFGKEEMGVRIPSPSHTQDSL